ncbi:MAG: phosphatase PAP2 family protein [Bacteroidota bacterium]
MNSRTLKLLSGHFILSFIVFLFLGAILLLNVEKGDLIFFFNKQHTPVVDLFFKWGTKLGEALPYTIGVLALVYLRKYAYAIAIPLLGAAVSLVSNLSKSFFAQYRPYTIFKQEGILDQIHFVEGVAISKAASSFPSGHTMSAFAIYFFLSLIFPQKKYLGLLFFLLALLVGLSRIYLVQHFFQDIYLGAIMGVALAFLFYLSASKLETLLQKPSVL